MHLGCAVWNRVSSRSFEVVCFGMPCWLCREWGDGRKGAAARVVNDSIPALMAASCACSMIQFAMSSRQCDQNDAKESLQDVNVSDGNVSMVVDGSFYKQGWNHKVSSCALYNLLGASTVARLLSTRCPWLVLSANSVWMPSCIQRLSSSSPQMTPRPSLCKTVHCRHVFCLNQRPSSLGPPFLLKKYRASAWRCICSNPSTAFQFRISSASAYIEIRFDRIS